MISLRDATEKVTNLDSLEMDIVGSGSSPSCRSAIRTLCPAAAKVRAMNSRRALVLVVPLLALALSCGGEGGGAEAVFEVPRAGEEQTFFSLPWPNDVYRTAEGHVDVSLFPNRRLVPVIDDYLQAITGRIDGWGTNTPIYFTFSEAIDEAALPADAEASLLADASVFLVDVDPDSPERGRRHAVVTRYRDEETVFWPSHCLAVRPVYGLPLAAGRRYAAVVTDALGTAAGARFRPSADLRALRGTGGDAAIERARDIYGPALDGLAEAGIEPASILSLAVFTTQDPTAELIAARDFIMEELPAPLPVDDAFAFVEDAGTHTLVHGAYGPSPIFQHGEIPYETEGGAMRFEAGVPVLAGDFTPRFALSIPSSEMPSAGYPIVLYAHGSGGDFESFARGDTAADLAAEGYAMMGVDQIHHGTRNPTVRDPVLLFFNFLNPDAFRDNGRQAALDVVSQARAVAGLVVPERTTGRDAPVRFDPDRIYFFGHSQGGNNGPLFLAIDDHVKAAVLSGAAATLTISLVEKVEPFDIPALVALFLRISGSPEVAVEREHIVYEHPVLALLQLWREADDNANYVHMLFDRPRTGFAPKTILQTEGVADRFTTARSVESLATAARIPLLGPVLQEIPAHGVVGLTTGSAPVSGNVADGAATAGLLQFDQGHFSAFNHPDARSQIRGFFRSLGDGPGTIPAP